MKHTDVTGTDRAQAFTLEGFVSALIVLTAILFALQAVVITPTTGGAVDRSTMAQEEQEIRDVLVIAGENGNLSYLVRHWNTSDGGDWHNESAPGDPAYNSSQFANITHFGKILDEQFVNASGKSYNVDFIGTDRDPVPIVRMGGGTSSSVVSASYFVTIHDDQTFTGSPDGPVSGGTNYPFRPDSESYTVVEVRVTVW